MASGGREGRGGFETEGERRDSKLERGTKGKKELVSTGEEGKKAFSDGAGDI